MIGLIFKIQKFCYEVEYHSIEFIDIEEAMNNLFYQAVGRNSSAGMNLGSVFCGCLLVSVNPFISWDCNL